MTPRRQNPFRPGRGVAPPVLAGREVELGRAGQHLDWLANGVMPPQDVLFYGPRGNGKTALLGELADRAKRLDLRVERFPVGALADRDALTEELQERAGVRRDRLSGLQVAGTGATAALVPPTRNTDSLLTGWLKAAPRPLVVLLDEAQAISIEAGRLFFDAVQSAKAGRSPFLLILAGTPDTPRRLREAGTHNERGFDAIPVGRLDRTASMAALEEPAAAAGLRMTPEAAEALADEARDYPYFVQLLGSAAWTAADRPGEDAIAGPAAEQAIAATRPRLDLFYQQRFAEARSRGVDHLLVPLAIRMREANGRLADREFRSLLRNAPREEPNPGSWTALLDTVTDLGVVWETPAGAWEMGIPSFADYVLRREAIPRPLPRQRARD